MMIKLILIFLIIANNAACGILWDEVKMKNGTGNFLVSNQTDATLEATITGKYSIEVSDTFLVNPSEEISHDFQYRYDSNEGLCGNWIIGFEVKDSSGKAIFSFDGEYCSRSPQIKVLCKDGKCDIPAS